MFKHCLFLLLCLLVTPRPFAQDNNNYYKIQSNQSGFILGRQAGVLMRDEIRARLEIWNTLLATYLDANGEKLLSKLNAKERWLNTLASNAPDLLEEIRGMAQGAGVDYYELLSYNLAEEIMTFYSQGYESCTNIAAYTSSGAAIAYNLDIPDFLHGNLKPSLITNNSQRILAFPGILATTVITNNYVITTNSLPDSKSSNHGLPLPFALRMMAELPSSDDVIRFLQDTPLSVAQNFMIIDRQHIYNVEKLSKETLVHTVPKAYKHYFHTNFTRLGAFNSQHQAKQCNRFQLLSGLKEQGYDFSSAQALRHAAKQTADEETFFTLHVQLFHSEKIPLVSLYLANHEQPFVIQAK